MKCLGRQDSKTDLRDIHNTPLQYVTQLHVRVFAEHRNMVRISSEDISGCILEAKQTKSDDLDDKFRASQKDTSICTHLFSLLFSLPFHTLSLCAPHHLLDHTLVLLPVERTSQSY